MEPTTKKRKISFSKKQVETLKGFGRALARYKTKVDEKNLEEVVRFRDEVKRMLESKNPESGIEREGMYIKAHNYIREGYLEGRDSLLYKKDRIVNSTLYNLGKMAFGGALLYLSYKTGGVFDLMLKTGSLYAVISSLSTMRRTKTRFKRFDGDMGYILALGRADILEKKGETFYNAREDYVMNSYKKGIFYLSNDRKSIVVKSLVLAATIGTLLHLTPVENFVKKQAISAKIGVERFIENFNKYYEWGKKI